MNGKIITDKDGKVIIEDAPKELNELIENSLEKMDEKPIFAGFDKESCESHGSDIPATYEEFKSIIDKNPSLGLKCPIVDDTDMKKTYEVYFKWVPESPKFKAYYAAKEPVLLGKLGEKGTELGTTNIHNAIQFDTKEECDQWIVKNSPPEWEATEHGFCTITRTKK